MSTEPVLSPKQAEVERAIRAWVAELPSMDPGDKNTSQSLLGLLARLGLPEPAPPKYIRASDILPMMEKLRDWPSMAACSGYKLHRYANELKKLYETAEAAVTQRPRVPGYDPGDDEDRFFPGDEAFQLVRHVERCLRNDSFDRVVQEIRGWLALVDRRKEPADANRYKNIMDKVARVLHPHWAVDQRGSYNPEELPSRVETLREELQRTKQRLARYETNADQND